MPTPQPPRPPAPPADDSAARPSAAVRALVLAGIAAAVLATFGGAVHNGWVMLDDPSYVLDNPHVTAGWTLAGLRWFLTVPHGGNWHPLTSYSHMLAVQLFGLAAGAHHAVDVCLHALDVVLLVWLLSRLTGAWWRPVLAGLLWGLHPLRVESVAWASERKDVLSMAFFLLTLLAYVRWSGRPGRARMALVALLLVLGLASKPMLVTTPLVLVLLDLWPLRRIPAPASVGGVARSLAQKWPLLLLVAGSAAATLYAQRAAHAVVPGSVAPLGHRLANAAVSVWRYVGATLWPAHLIPFHPDAPVPPAAAIASAAAIVLVTAFAWNRRGREPWLAVGWSWYLVTLLPVIGLVQVGGQAWADRYAYLPTIGLFLAAAACPLPRFARVPAAAVAAALAVVLACVSARQVALWKDSATLFSATLRVSPDNAVAHNSLGIALASADPAAAEREFRAAVRIWPGYLEAHLNLGELLHEAGRDSEALAGYEALLRPLPRHAGLWHRAGQSLFALGRTAAADSAYRRSLALDPDQPAALREFALVCEREGRPAQAVALLLGSEKLAPGDADTQYELGRAIAFAGGPAAEALRHESRAAALRRGWPAPLTVMAELLLASTEPGLRDPARALALADSAVALSHPPNAGAFAVRGAALAALGRRAEAAHADSAALELAGRAHADVLAAHLRQSLAGLAGGVAAR